MKLRQLTVFTAFAAISSLAFVSLPAQAAAAAAATPQRRVALVVGNARYSDVPALVNSANDAADMCAALRELKFETLCVQDVKSRREFKQHLQAFKAKLGPGTASLFYYAGHGVQIDGENYLLPTAAQIKDKEDVEDETLSMRFVMTVLEEAKSDFNLVILDACRNSPFTRGFTRNIGRGLAAINDAPTGSLVLYATAANEQASDGAKGERNSPFAKHLLAHMRQPGLPVELLVKKVSAAVQAETFRVSRKRQVPFSYGSFTGEFCFAGCASPTHSADVEKLRQDQAALAQRQAELARREAEMRQQAAPAAQPPATRRVVVPPAF